MDSAHPSSANTSQSMAIPRLSKARPRFLLSSAESHATCMVGSLPKRLPQLAYIVLALAVLPSPYALGQAAIPADKSNQEAFREQERLRALRQQQERRSDVHLQQAATADATRLRFDEAPCFNIDRLTLNGDAARQFQWALAAADSAGKEPDQASGHCLGASAISLVVRRVQNAILDRGFVTTRVLVEPQDLKTGTLKLTLIPGRIRGIRLLPGSDTRATLFNAIPAGSGDLLNLRDVEQALENFKRPPTAEADIQILPAEAANAKPGESDLGIRRKQGFPIRVSVSADDSGSRATGKRQGSVTISYDDLFALNDLFYVNYSHDLEGDAALHGTRARSFHYSIPCGYWLLAASASSSPYYQTVSGASQNYVYRGNSENAAITLSRLLYRDAKRKTTLTVGGWARASRNFIDDTEVEVQRRRMAGWELVVAHRELFGAASLDMSLTLRRGTGAANALRAPEEAFGEGTSRSAVMLTDGNVNLAFGVFGLPLRYTGVWRLQHNRTPLITQDRFSIGGRYTVRGFDGESSLVAERGWFLRNELSAALGVSGQEVYVGLDHGEVRGPTTLALTGKRLSGAVIGLRGQIMRLRYDVFTGTPVRKPESFRTAGSSAGFSINLNF